MSKLITISVSLVLSLLLLLCINENTEAQSSYNSEYVTNPGDVTFGAGITHGTSTGFLGNPEFGLTGQILYTVTEEFRGGIDYTYYLIGERQLSANELNLNVHYFVRNRNNLTLYGLGGINISNTSGSDQIWRE